MKLEIVEAGEPTTFCKGLTDLREDALDPRSFFEEVERKWLWEKKCEDRAATNRRLTVNPLLSSRPVLIKSSGC
jgi:hypothetical protein